MDRVFGTDSLYYDSSVGLGLAWNDVAFYHKLDDKKANLEGGFILSRYKGEIYSDSSVMNEFDLYKANAHKDSTSTYLVFRQTDSMPTHDIEFLYAEYGVCKLTGCFVTIPKAVAHAATKYFKNGDKLTLKATGYRGKEKTGESTIDLISFTEAENSIMSEWTFLDLSKLGNIQYIDLDITSSSPEVPTAICVDDVYGNVAIAY